MNTIKKLLIVSIISLFITTNAYAAIAFGGISASRTDTSTGTSVAVSGSNTIGFLATYSDSGADNVSAITWGGVSMTRIGTVVVPGDRGWSVWYIINPSSSATISITGGGAWGWYTWYYTGAKQSGQPDSSNSGTSSGSTQISLSTTVVASNSWTVMAHKDNQGGRTYSTSVGTMRLATDGGGIAIADSNGTVGTGSQTITLTEAFADNHGAVIFSIAPEATASAFNFWGVFNF